MDPKSAKLTMKPAAKPLIKVMKLSKMNPFVPWKLWRNATTSQVRKKATKHNQKFCLIPTINFSDFLVHDYLDFCTFFSRFFDNFWYFK